jgi:hypothetical protein
MEIKRIIEGWDDESQIVIGKFLESYKEKAGATYKTSFRHIHKHTGKSHIKELSIEDYKSLHEIKIAHVNQIFKFLYAYDYLENSEEFKKEFGNKDNIRSGLEKKKNDSKEIRIYKPAISAQDLDKIIKFVEQVEEKDFEIIRLAVCFHILFYETIDVNHIRALDVIDFADGYIILSDDEYSRKIKMPERFYPFLEDLKKKGPKTKFTSVHLYISDLGKEVGIDDLHPKDIIDARKQRLMICPECGIEYLATLENWISVNHYLECINCFQKRSLSVEVKKTG